MRISTTIKTLTLSAACLFAFDAYSQGNPVKKFGKPVSGEVVRCATTEYESLLQKRNPQRPNQQQFEEWLAPKVAAAKARRQQNRNTNTVVTIPVVVHVIHNGVPVGTMENISDEQILSQLTVLNQDFRRMAGTNGFNDNPVGADMEIEFCLAQRDPQGMASTGIERLTIFNNSPIGWDMQDLELIKAQTQWDPEKYLNIWVVSNIVTNGVLTLAGYAQFPTNSGLDGMSDPSMPTTANTDGVVIAANCFGSSEYYPEGTYMQGRNMGRTASHEIGHYLGLRHIWGDGNCSVDDYCEDTPVTAAANQGCAANTDSCPNSPGVDMIENYMDYTDDSCQNVFTQDQKDRMMAVLANSPRRASLLTANSCTPGAVMDNDGSLNILNIGDICIGDINPVIELKNTGTATITSAVIGYNLNEEELSTINWEGGLAPGETAEVEIPSSSVISGDHTFSYTLVSVNGEADMAPSNDTKTLPLSVETHTTHQVKVEIRTDNAGAGIIWALLDSSGEPVATNEDSPYGNNQTYYHVIDIEQSACYTFMIIDTGIDGLTGEGYYKVKTAQGTVMKEGGEFFIMEAYNFGIEALLSNDDFSKSIDKIKLYPNPASSTITLAIPDAAALPEGYTVYNSLGQVTGSGKISSNTQSLDISGYANGVYFIKIDKGTSSKTLKFIKS